MTDFMANYIATFGLIFGGCCSNALTLEVITSQFPPAGSLITFAQFLVVSIVGLYKQVIVLPPRISKDEAIRHVVSELSTLKDRQKDLTPLVVFVHYAESQNALAFAQQVANSIRSSMTRVEVFLGEEAQKHLKGAINIDIVSSVKSSSEIAIDISHPDRPAVWFSQRRQFTLNPFRIRLKPRRIPLARYAVQVLLFLLISLLNNAAFAYRVPMAVHIIFRSGGLVVNMLMGYILEHRRYTKLQAASVLLVTLGVAFTTLSANKSKPPRSHSVSSTELGVEASSYAIGIGILTIALILSGFLGLSQDKTYEKYGRGNWEEAMFYLHALSLPLFSLVRSELVGQIRMANKGSQTEVGFNTFHTVTEGQASPLPYLPLKLPTLRVPSFYIPLALNVLTQFVCVSGVNRLTSRVNSLTVTLVLVVRKATSLAISVLLLGDSQGNWLLWAGASAVLLGTVGYSMGGRSVSKKKEA